jgi:N utilization substance protein A
VQRVSIVDDEQKVMEVVVEDRQLSLAIGKKGQNVRLAAKLTGWKIDIKSEEDKRKEVEAQLAGIDFGAGAEATRPLVLPDIHEDVIAALKAAGYDTVEKVLDAGADNLATLPGFDADTVEAVLAAAAAQRETDAAEQAAAEAAAGADAGDQGESDAAAEEAETPEAAAGAPEEEQNT